MLALANHKVDLLIRRGFETPVVYNPAGVGGTHMMYVVPHGDHLNEYRLPADPIASPMPLTFHSAVKRIGSYLFGLGLFATLFHFLAVGPESPEEDRGSAP